jgi:Hypervirulence associated proteins TUDOR domain
MANDNSFQTNQYVEWDWGNGTAKGQIAERFERDVTRTLKGSEVTRNGSADNPAYLIRQDDGDEVLKLGSEIRAQDD